MFVNAETIFIINGLWFIKELSIKSNHHKGIIGHANLIGPIYWIIPSKKLIDKMDAFIVVIIGPKCRIA